VILLAEVKSGLVLRSYQIFKTIKKIGPYTNNEVNGMLSLSVMEQNHTLRSFLDKRHDGAGLKFLQEVLGNHIVEAVEAKENGKKVVMIPFNFPPEVIHLFDNAVPYTTEVVTTIGVCALTHQGEPYWDYALSWVFRILYVPQIQLHWDPCYSQRKEMSFRLI